MNNNCDMHENSLALHETYPSEFAIEPTYLVSHQHQHELGHQVQRTPPKMSPPDPRPPLCPTPHPCLQQIHPFNAHVLHSTKMCNFQHVQPQSFIRCRPVLSSRQAAVFKVKALLLSHKLLSMCVHLTMRAGVLRVLIPASIGDQVACEVIEGCPAIHSFFNARNHLCP
jgi:hypothetical protein